MFKFTRVFDFPVLEPLSENQWESQAVLNPAAILVNGETRLYYRAVEAGNYSSIGYARFDTQGNLLYRHSEPVIKRELPEEVHGVEDPRIIEYDGRYLMFYTAYDGEKTKVAVAETENFIDFKRLGTIQLDAMDKDAFIFPEKVNGELIYAHRVDPDIQFAYFDSLEDLLNADERFWKKYMDKLSDYNIVQSKFPWENMKVGGGMPPIKTEAGWLFVYHGVERLNDQNDRVYRAGVFLTDLHRPEKVIARLPYPVLEPEREWEQVGDVNNVVFPTGGYLFEGNLYVYYGCADRVIGLAKGSLTELVEALLKEGETF